MYFLIGSHYFLFIHETPIYKTVLIKNIFLFLSLWLRIENIIVISENIVISCY